MSEFDETKTRLKERLLERIDFSREVSDIEIREMIDEEIVLVGRYLYLSLAQKNRLGKELFASIRKLDI